MTGFDQIRSFRKIAKLGSKRSVEELHAESVKFARDVATNPYYDKFFSDRTAVMSLAGGTSGWAEKMTKHQLEQYTSAVDSASLVFAHSVLDGVAIDFCRTVAIGFPETWEQFIENRKIDYKDVKTSDFETIRSSLIDANIESLEKESLLKKSDRLFQVCRPEPDFDPIEGYSFDRNKLDELDQLRHKIVHSPENLSKLPMIEEDLEFLSKTGLYFMALVNHRFDLKWNFDAIFPGRSA